MSSKISVSSLISLVNLLKWLSGSESSPLYSVTEHFQQNMTLQTNVSLMTAAVLAGFSQKQSTSEEWEIIQHFPTKRFYKPRKDKIPSRLSHISFSGSPSHNCLIFFEYNYPGTQNPTPHMQHRHLAWFCPG